jgi:hypothetical protein
MKLTLNYEDHDFLMGALNQHEHFCNCPDFPHCEDFQRFLKLKRRVESLPIRSEKSVPNGRRAARKNREKLRMIGFKDGIDSHSAYIRGGIP